MVAVLTEGGGLYVDHVDIYILYELFTYRSFVYGKEKKRKNIMLNDIIFLYDYAPSVY